MPSYSGIWKLSSQGQAVQQGLWPTPPFAGGQLWAWGSGDSGTLGLNNTTYYSSPVQVGSDTSWLVISVGAPFTAAIKNNNTLWTWGANSQGQLGSGNTTPRSSPVQVGALTNWSTVSCGNGGQFMIAIKTDGTLWSWGRNDFGSLGLGNFTNYSSPKQVGVLTNWSAISCSALAVAAIKTDGTLWTWGDRTYGQLGLGNIGAGYSYSSPTQVGALTNWSSVEGGQEFFLATKTNGTLWAWGRNNNGQLGFGNNFNYSSPVQIGALTTWLSISAGAYHSLSVKTDGTLWAWGKGTNGRLGLGNITNYNSPKQVGALADWLYVAAGYNNSLSIKTNKSLWSWGGNNTGQLGLGNTTDYSSPKQVGSLITWQRFACKPSSGAATLAIKT